jgi:putative PIG3 family NAD(P)H quinone oxidoreductase
VKAIVITKPGGPDVLRLSEVATPEPARGEVRVRVRAAAVNRADLLQRMGHYPAPPDAPNDVPGLEIAGEVEAVGEGVVDLAKGDAIFGLVSGGGYAEYVVAHARTMVRMPEGLSFEKAAAIPEAFITAWDAMVTQARLAAGETVLIHAVGSGVGTAAVQIARSVGATAIGTARTQAKLDSVLAQALGLRHGVHTKDATFADRVRALTPGKAGVDVVLELVGGAYVPEDLHCMAQRGRMVVVGLLAGAGTQLDLGMVLRRRLEIIGTVLRARPLEEKILAARAFERHIVPLVARGDYKAIIDRTYPLADAAQAHAYVASNETLGKVVLAVA